MSDEISKDYGERKKLLKDKNALVTTPIGRLSSGLTKSKPGRKKRFTPTKIKNQINKYFCWCEENDEMPSIKGLMIYLDMTKDQFYVYKGYPEFTDIMERTQLIISNWVETDIYNTKGMAAGKIAYAKNVMDWTEKIESNQNVTQKVITVDEARAKIEMLAPKLLELLQSNTVLKQLAAPVVEADVVEKTERRI